MEALLALLLFSSFSIVIGMYWQHLIVNQKKAELRLQALSYANDVIDGLLLGEKFENLQPHSKKYAVTIDKRSSVMPRVKKGTLKHLDAVQFYKITVSSKNEQIDLITLVPERV